jgi:hypothetical protein
LKRYRVRTLEFKPDHLLGLADEELMAALRNFIALDKELVESLQTDPKMPTDLQGLNRVLPVRARRIELAIFQVLSAADRYVVGSPSFIMEAQAAGMPKKARYRALAGGWSVRTWRCKCSCRRMLTPSWVIHAVLSSWSSAAAAPGRRDARRLCERLAGAVV